MSSCEIQLLIMGFYSLRHNSHIHMMGHGYYTLDNRSYSLVRIDVLDKAAVQLHFVSREIPEVTQAGETCTKVIYGCQSLANAISSSELPEHGAGSS